jgi:hypothetical protein
VKKRILLSIVVLVVIVIAIQLIPVDRSNPPVVADFDGPAEVTSVLRASCYDCHSHETTWPWYSRVAPVSWLVAHDVEEGREHVNLSLWGTLEPKRQARIAEEMWEEVEEGEMPLAMYLLAHPEARLSEEAKATLRGWATAMERAED